MRISVRPGDLIIRKQQLLKSFGCNLQSPSEVKASLEKALNITSALAMPEAVYLERSINGFSGEGLTVRGGDTFKTMNIGRYLSSCCSRIVIFIATIGNRLEEEVSRMMDKGDSLLALALDATASQYIESFTEYISSYIAAQQPGSIAPTRRYSPGYCDWGITDQSVIFRLLKAQKVGVTLNEQYLMSPLKSISGIMGLGEEAVIVATPTPCQVCKDNDCPHRR